MDEQNWLQSQSPAFRLMIATSWLAPETWRLRQDQMIREVIGSGFDWSAYLSLVARHRTPVVSWMSLNRVADLAIPEPVRSKLKQESIKVQKHTLRILIMLSEVLKAFEQEELPVMVLKGPLLSLELYGDPTLRQTRDLDIACRIEDLQRAHNCLQHLGFKLEESKFGNLTPREWSNVIRHEHHLEFVHTRTRLQLELHWRELGENNRNTELRWSRAISTRWQGIAFWQMDVTDQVLYLSQHGARHAWFRAKWLGDLAAFHASSRIDWATCLNRAQDMNLEPVLVSTSRLLQLLYLMPMPIMEGQRRERAAGMLTRESLHVLASPLPNGVMEKLRETIWGRLYLFCVLQFPSFKAIVQHFSYSRVDRIVLPLPDRWHWLYLPLRPFLFLWRHAFMKRKFAGH